MTDAVLVGTGMLCAYCGEFSPGDPPPKQKALDFEDFYPDTDEVFTFTGDKPDPLKLAAWVEKHVETYEATECPSCHEHLVDDDALVGTFWKCSECGELSDIEEEANRCCEWRREQEQRALQYQAEQEQHAERDAIAMLISKGYSVNKLNTDISSDFIYPSGA